ncbi:YitT family protein [Halobacillus sp. A1]|uniref:YitT family protein n=1 Tax=Halobacillus campisalis TaxID=435909 RepID=A0ABW2K2L7_9BACI|nr:MULTISPECIES: YitT family protein [Halobacillus]MCP3030414.1 YitT family protein [Halobacillus sp. A1]
MKNDQYVRPHTGLRWSFFIVGLTLLGLGISLTMQVRVFGIGPWDVLHYGLYKQLGLTVGTWSIIAGLLIVIISSIVLRTFPKIGTILNMVLIGVFIDFFNWILPEPSWLLNQVIFFVAGTMITALGIGVYVAADIGAGPRDSLMLILTDKLQWKVSTVRNGIEVTVALLGWMLGGPVGIGTVFIALFLGSFVGYSLPLSKRLLNFLMKKGESYENFYKGPLRPDHHDRIG